MEITFAIVIIGGSLTGCLWSFWDFVKHPPVDENYRRMHLGDD